MAAPKAPRSFPSITCIGSCRISASIWVQTGEFVMPPDKRICFWGCMVPVSFSMWQQEEKGFPHK